MKTNTKSVLIIAVTFVLGFVLGIVVDRTIVEHQMRERFGRFSRPGMERYFLERIIQPSPEQKIQIDSILQKYGEKFRQLRFDTRARTRAIMDSMRHEIEPILTEEQKERIRRDLERLKIEAGRRRLPFGKERRRDFGEPPEKMHQDFQFPPPPPPNE